MMFCLLNRFGSASIRQCYPTLSKSNIRSLSIKRKPKHVKLADPSVHKVVYSFKYIRLCSGFLASKLHLPIVSAVVGPCASYYLNSWEPIIALIMANVIHLTIVTLATRFLNNVVGLVFVNKEGKMNEVIFSSIDKWGRRIDRKHKVDEIFVVSANPMITTAGFFIVAVQDSDVRYKVNFKNCRIHDLSACKFLFDDFEFVKPVKK